MAAYIVMAGDPGAGFTFHGPFEEHDDAVNFAERIKDVSWWVCELEPVEPPEPD